MVVLPLHKSMTMCCRFVPAAGAVEVHYHRVVAKHAEHVGAARRHVNMAGRCSRCREEHVLRCDVAMVMGF